MKIKRIKIPTRFSFTLTEAEIGHIIIALNYIGNDTLVCDDTEALNTIIAKLSIPLAYKALEQTNKV